MNYWENIKASFKQSSVLHQLIYINIGVFVVVKLLEMISFLMNRNTFFADVFVQFFSVKSSLDELITHPWGIFTYMFLHQNFFHILINLLWFYWFGRIFLFFMNPRQMINVYIFGGLSGAFLYVLFFNVFPAFQQSVKLSYAIGASASIMAVVVAISMYVPNYSVYLFFFKQIKIKYIALVTIFMDIVSIQSDDNAGGHIAHLGGAIFGALFIFYLKKGKDISFNFSRITMGFRKMFDKKPKFKYEAKNMSDWDYNKQQSENQKQIDEILEKLKRSGYDSLTKEEKQFLFSASNKK